MAGRPKGSTKKNRAKRGRASSPKPKATPKQSKPVKEEVEEVVAETPEQKVQEPVSYEKPEPTPEPPIQEITVEEPEIIKEETMTQTAEPIQAAPAADEDIPMEGFNPLSEPVVERAYTKEMIEKDMGAGGDIPASGYEEVIPEPTYDNPYPEGDADIPSSSSSSSSAGGGYSGSSSEPKPPINPALDDMPKGEKRKAAKKTADALLTTYARVFPYPFKRISSFNMNKMERLDMQGEIDLKMVVTEDGKTVRQHMEAVNQQVDEVFVITEEMQEELREPLVDLLMEQELALTPTQRLMMVLGGHAVQFTTATIQIAVSNKHALNTFREFRAEQGNARPTAQAQPTPQPQPQPQAQPIQEQAYESPMGEAEEEQPYEAPFGMEDYLSGNLEDEVASVENGQIVVEEEPNE